MNLQPDGSRKYNFMIAVYFVRQVNVYDAYVVYIQINFTRRKFLRLTRSGRFSKLDL